MKTLKNLTSIKTITRTAAGLAAAAGLLSLPALADDSLTMAPPISAPYDQGVSDAPDNASADTVFKWTETPEGEEVTITRAVFDKGGYQLYDTHGETIVVPFTDRNLYVMKFAPSANGQTYFINEGAVPVLYVPRDGYLENATVPGARWYPFSSEFHPNHPVYEGIAPSYSQFVDLGWYPDTRCYGGYYSNTAFVAGGVFLPSVGLFFNIGGHPVYGWDGYRDYDRFHPAPYRVSYFHENNYFFADRPASDFHRFGDDGFGGGHPYYAHQAFAGGGGFGGGDHFGGSPVYTHRTFQGDGSFANRGFGNQDGGGSHTYTNGGGHTFNGGGFGDHTTNNASGGFGGNGPRPGIVRGGDQGNGGRTFGGGNQGFGGQSAGGGRTFGGGQNVGGGNQGFASGSQGSGGRTFGTGNTHQDTGGGFGGNGGHTFTGRGTDTAQNPGPRPSISRGNFGGGGSQNFGGNLNSGGSQNFGGNQNSSGGGRGFGGNGGGSFSQGNDRGGGNGGGFGGGNGGGFGGGGNGGGGSHVRGR